MKMYPKSLNYAPSPSACLAERICKFIWNNLNALHWGNCNRFFSLTFAFRTLIYVYAFKIHLCNCHRRVDRIFNVPKLGVAGIDIYNRHDGCYFPSIRASTIKIRSGKFHWPRVFVGSSWSVEWKSGICIVKVANTYVVYSFWIMPLSDVSIIW